MFKTNYKIGALVALVAFSVGCSKKAVDTPAPANAQATSNDGTSAKSKNLWTVYLDNIEAGKQKDPTGQYVSKTTKVPNGDGKSPRPTRPKLSLTKDLVTNLYPQPTDPIQECPCDNPTGGAPPEPSTAFFSSEGIQMGVNPTDNPNNYILNLDIIKGDYDFGLNARAGFVKIPVNLNKGAGGKNIFLCYSRKNTDMADIHFFDPQGSQNPSVANDVMHKAPVTDIQITTESFFGTITPVRTTGFDWIYQYNGIFPYDWTYPDLNDEAGGKYIYASYTKGFRAGGSLNVNSLSQTPIKDVGVIYSNDENIQPPLGWKIIRADLNEGAGGYYIYICIKK